MRAFVTGGLGFIGCNMVSRLLQDGHDVVIFDNASRAGVLTNLEWLRAEYPGRVRWIEGDVRDSAAVDHAIQGADIVFHFAAQVAVTTSVANPRTDFEINALGALNVLEAARRLNTPPPFLFTSTNKVYGGLEGVRVEEGSTRYRLVDCEEGIPETFPLDFHSPYGCSKGAADQYVRDYFRIYGLPTIVFRMSCIYGLRQMGNEDQGWVAHLARTALQGGDLRIFGDGKQVRDLLFVEDLIEAMLRAVNRIDRTAGQVFNLGGGPQHTLSVWVEFREQLKGLLGRMPEAQMGPWRPGDQRIYVSDIRKAQNELDWTPKVGIAAGLSRMVGDWQVRGITSKLSAD
jgi:CDP-paratose 2-epimerase